MVVTGHPSQIRNPLHIRAHADPDWRFGIFDATSAFGLPSVHGPASRMILQALSGDDLGNAAFPFGAAREIDLAHARVWAIRRSFLGELGYELIISTEFWAHVHEALMRVGADHGLRHAGMFAMGACRLEKGFCHFGHDIGEGITSIFNGVHAWNLRSHFQFHGRGDAADAQVGAVVVASPWPFRGLILCLLDAFEDVLIQPLMPNRPVIALDICVLLRLSGLDVLDGDTCLSAT